MADPFITTPFAEGKFYEETYLGKRARMCLAVNSGSLSVSSTTAQWDAAELSGNGYARVEWTIPAGSYNSTTGRFQAPVQQCEFLATAGGQGLTSNTIYIVLGTVSNNVTTWQTGVHAILETSLAIVPNNGKKIDLTLFTNGFNVTS
jgi:hypothetical protein